MEKDYEMITVKGYIEILDQESRQQQEIEKIISDRYTVKQRHNTAVKIMENLLEQ